MRQAIRFLLTGITGLFGLAGGVAIVLALAVLVLPLPALAAAPEPKPWDVTVTVSEAFLARELNARQGDQTSPIKDAKVSFQADGTVKVTGTLAPSGTAGGTGSGTGVSLPIPRPPQGQGVLIDDNGLLATIVLRPTVENDRLKTEVVSLQVGPLGVPGQLAGLLDGPLNTQLNNALGDRPYRLVEVGVQNGQLTMRAKRI